MKTKYEISYANGTTSETYTRIRDAERALRREAKRLRGGLRIDEVTITSDGVYDQDGYCHAGLRVTQ